MNDKTKVLVAMSGGVDSSVAAILLHEKGYDVIGITMKTWDYKGSKIAKTGKITGCCDLDSMNDARKVAVKYNFPHYVVDIRKDFGKYVINNFKNEYLNGRTPNPCVLCNTHIKWDSLLERAEMLGCDFIATGHYAKVNKYKDRYFISKGLDQDKDQSYALWGVSQDSLKKTILPLGNLKKTEIKKIAYEKGFEDLAKKSESYEICFIPDNDYRGFLKKNEPSLEKKVKNGDFILEDGTIVGKHEGYPFYTIGQRKGLGLALGYPVYVSKILPKENKVVIGTYRELAKKGMLVDKIILSKYENIDTIDDVLTKIRYNDRGTFSYISKNSNQIKVIFKKEVYAVAPGQAAVFYENDDLIGGGWIKSSF